MKTDNSPALHRKYRPKTLEEVVGNKDAVAVMRTAIAKKTQVVLLTGVSGGGKTTLARIFAKAMKCSKQDFKEVDAAQDNGIDVVRDIKRTMTLAPMGGESRIYLIDECHQLTNAAQNGMLKILEDTPPGVYFILCTTDPAKLLTTLVNRCTRAAVKPLTLAEAGTLFDRVSSAEGFQLCDEVRENIFDAAQGSARHMLTILETVAALKTPAEQLDAISTADAKKSAIDLCRLLTGNGAANWSAVTATLKGITEEPEKVRRAVLGYCNACLLGQKSNTAFASRCFLIIQCFGKNYFDTGMAGLTASCYDVAFGK